MSLDSMRVCALTAMLLLNLAPCDEECSIAGAGASASRPDAAGRQGRLRVALIGFALTKATNDTGVLELALVEAVGRDARVVLVDDSMIRPALKGIGYDGSINMSKDEARKLAAAIGCDCFIVGKAEVFTRSERESESHEQAYAAVMIVDGRTGALADFEFFSEKAATKEAASSAIIKSIERGAAGFVDRVIQFRAQSQSQPAQRASTALDLIEDMPDLDSPRAVGSNPPEFLNRVKPEYTSEAELADITATVEALVVFRSNGEVGTVEITRWAGFGLDESAARAIRQLRLKPATREGKPINVRALVRYNFRRLSEPKRGPRPAP